VGRERDGSIARSGASSMTVFREVKTIVDDLIVELEVKSQIDKDVSRSPVIEVGRERDASITSSAATSMTVFREVKLTADGLTVEQEVKSQIDKDVSRSPVIEVGRERDASITSSAASSMTVFREETSADDDLTVEQEVKSQIDKNRTHTNSEVGGEEKKFKNK
jgi:hypothetical protein